MDKTINTYTDSPCPDSSAFLNWGEESLESEPEKAVVFRSLVAAVKLQPALDASLQAKAVKFLKCVDPQNTESAEDFLNSLGRTTDESSTIFVQSIVLLLSSPNRAIATTAMQILESISVTCSRNSRLGLIKADLLPHLIASLNPLSQYFAEAVDIHMNVMKTITNSLWLATPFGLRQFGIEDENEQQTVQETVLQQVLIPSEGYICHLCDNRYSIIDGDQFGYFLSLLTQLLGISPSHQPTKELVLNMPVFLTIPSCLAFFEHDRSIFSFLYFLVDAQREWNNQRGEVRQLGKTMLRMLRMEGFEDVIEEQLPNDKSRTYGRHIGHGFGM
ncbi:hypothetical protein BLNAU_7463 [Blattamonas nauphoetae]|uniref:Uncharacterized protein n=1 Tax=Blattamonas nauphoetae TaxID=2049346 RepID=A0ABQ9Y1M8_9EUKA|nr:hypothetical protein BLNAU_7463 [Blattamonas nauphoetae]